MQLLPRLIARLSLDAIAAAFDRDEIGSDNDPISL